jgi:hypothetical protein
MPCTAKLLALFTIPVLSAILNLSTDLNFDQFKL